MNERPVLVLLGAPGAGKGTQAKLLAERYRLAHLSTGDVLREAVEKGSALGRQVRSIMEAGELVPDALVSRIVRHRLNESNSGGFVLDGYPRNLNQAEFLQEVTAGRPLAVIHIVVNPEQLRKRLSGRRHCPDCGKLYNVHFSPPQREGVCDACGSELIQRKDDQEEVVAERLRVYREETEPLVDFYAAGDGYFEIDGNQDAETVFQGIAKQLQRSLPKLGEAVASHEGRE